MAIRKKCVRIGCANVIQYSKHGVCTWHYKELMGTYPQRPQKSKPLNSARNKTEWEWIKEHLGL